MIKNAELSEKIEMYTYCPYCSLLISTLYDIGFDDMNDDALIKCPHCNKTMRLKE